MTDNRKYAVFGNPIKHSKSPIIHAAFAQQCDLELQYRAVGVELDNFARAATNFFADGGDGLNVTVPFKREAFDLADELSDRARRAGAANTLTPLPGGGIQGDNTDGIGLVSDMVANLGWLLADLRVLILGAEYNIVRLRSARQEDLADTEEAE